MTTKLNRWLSVAFLGLAGLFFVYKSLERPRILVLHSYYTDFSWVRDINVGIERALQDRPYNVRYHYMDTKRHPSDAFKKLAGRSARRMIREWRPNVVIALDDNAQLHTMRHFVDDPEIAILYAGVNGKLSSYGFDDGLNVTGIAESIPWQAALDQLKALLPSGSRLLHLSDLSESSHAVHDSIMEFDWSPFEFVGSYEIERFDEWQRRVLEAKGQVDCLLITHYHTIKEPGDSDKVLKPAGIIEWTEANTDIPTVGFWGFFVEDGGMMAVGLSPFEQGEEPAKIAVEIIEKNIDPLEVSKLYHKMDNELFVMYVRQSAFKKRWPEQEIPALLEAFSRAMDGYYE